ncbi:MAG: hypothetical protein WCK55_11890 [Verrucomicrobiota bacterium]
MDLYRHPVFDMACHQFDLAADHLEIPTAFRDRLKYPKRALTAAIPIHRDDGKLNGCQSRVASSQNDTVE